MAQYVATVNRERWCDVLPGPRWIDQVNLPSAAAVAYVVPADVNLVRVSCADPAEWAFVRWYGGSAASPTATISDGTGSELIPQNGFLEAQVEPGQSISFKIGNNPTTISVACFRTASL